MSTGAIVAALDRAGVSVQAVGNPLAAPQVVTYAVAPVPGQMRKALAQRERLQATLRTPEPPRILQRGRWLLVEVPRRNRRNVPLDRMQGEGLRVQVGIAPTGKRLAIDLQETPHVLVAGQTGSGKSVALRAIARGLALSPSKVSLVLIDLDGDTWAPLSNAAALRHAVADGPLAARTALEGVQGAMSDSGRERAIVALVDEAQMLDAQSLEACRDIAQRGRKANVHLVLATQYVRSDVLDRRLTDQCSARVLGRMQDGAAGRWAGSTDVASLQGAGDMIASLAGVETRVQVAWAERGVEDVAWAAVPRSEPRPAPEPIEPAREIPHDALVWCVSRAAIEGSVPGINRIANRFGVGNTKASRWQAEARATLSRHPIPAGGGRVIPFRRAG